jgi:hypothetical protein
VTSSHTESESAKGFCPYCQTTNLLHFLKCSRERCMFVLDKGIEVPVSDEKQDSEYDGAPYCSDCGARKRQHCKCPPRPRND